MGHYTHTQNLNLHSGNTGELPSATDVSDPIIRAWLWARNWLPQQIFTYSGPGPYTTNEFYNPDYNYDYDYPKPCFEIIMHKPPKADTSNPNRQLYDGE